MTPKKKATEAQLERFMSRITALIDEQTDGWGDCEGLQLVENIVNDIIDRSTLVTPGPLTLDWGAGKNCYLGFQRRSGS